MQLEVQIITCLPVVEIIFLTTKDQANNLLFQMDCMVRRRDSTKVKAFVEHFEPIKEQFVQCIEAVVIIRDIQLG